MVARAQGDVTLRTSSTEGGSAQLPLKDVLHVPSLTNNLISVPTLDRAGHQVTSADGRAVVSHGGRVIAVAPLRDGLYQLEVGGELSAAALTAAAREKELSRDENLLALWHKRLGHLSVAALRKLGADAASEVPAFAADTALPFCAPCAMGKATRRPHPSRAETAWATEPLEVVHTDVCGHLRLRRTN
jgi:hypothetical protein